LPTRILNVIRFPIGGIRNYLRYTYSRLDPDVFTSTIVTIDVPEAHLLPQGMAPLNVDLTTVPVTRPVLRLFLAAKRLIRGGGVGLVHSQGTTAAIVSASSSRRHRVPHVVTLHETFRAEQFSGLTGEAKRRVLARVFDNVDAVIAVSRDARDNLLQHLPLNRHTADRVVVIRNGVAVDMLVHEAGASRPELREQLNVDASVPVMGYIGRFMPEKGFGVLVDAVRLLRDRKELPPFKVVAVNDGAYVREYREQVSELGLAPWFHFTGFKASAAGTLAELDAVIMPSLREACPLVAMEAMVLGCPLIASDCIGLRELTVGTPALQSVAGDAASLASAIGQFLANHGAIKQSARLYIPDARRSFDSSRAVESLLSVFSRVSNTQELGMPSTR
jgi:glycosyltransferase involved in cell wall biosynthesis